MKESLNRYWICLLEALAQLTRRLFLWTRREKMAPPALSSPLTTAMVCAARQGRLRQRYEGCYRLVSGCIPYMLKEEEEGKSSCQDVLGRLQVLMISTPKRGDLIFPKGGWEDDESIDEAACCARRRLPRPLLPPDGALRLGDQPWMARLATVSCVALAGKVEETRVSLLLDLQLCAAAGTDPPTPTCSRPRRCAGWGCSCSLRSTSALVTTTKSFYSASATLSLTASSRPSSGTAAAAGFPTRSLPPAPFLLTGVRQVQL